MTSCHIQAGHADSPVILHVPHASRSIPDTVRAGILLSNDKLQLELDESTDTATDHIAIRAAELLASGRPRPWLAINQISRLVIDPERFPGDDEPMNAVGRGAVYTRTCNRALLRLEPAADAQRLMDSYYQPYTAALTGLVDDRIATTGAAVIIDVHSYPRHPSRFENPNKPRPALCLGTDDFHTPGWLREQALDAFAPLGDIATNNFAATSTSQRRAPRTRPRWTHSPACSQPSSPTALRKWPPTDVPTQTRATLLPAHAHPTHPRPHQTERCTPRTC
ncbi:N-formylglutamate amidohydrolase [Rhodococcus opacus]|uniref:N-formylglutamate amidohydrolase n=1 Tax=Rhodococcus opacus TaxID=37919 RepID=UPI00211F0CEC|nr:N-formylglutamate amidohydrolase [Rhodococcus opacus]